MRAGTPALLLVVGLMCWLLAPSRAPSVAIARYDGPDFDAEIRPVLSEHCFHCHGSDAARRQAGLRLDMRGSALARRAIVPGDPKASLLVERIRSTDPSSVMPPPDAHRELGPAQRELLERWVAAGAPYRPHWAFVPPERTPTPPGVNPIDAIVEARLRTEGLSIAPQAAPATLIRRLALDLTGLPPKPEEVAAFVADHDPDAYGRLVDRLLDSPHYGERMAIPWLDMARYADSNGFQQDGDTFQWLWRDWLVRELNRDTPYDRLSTLMLAGDLLPGASDDTRIGTAFLRNNLLNGEGGAIPEENRWIAMFDRVDTISTTWLGLTLSCAQCHDHKYDAATQRDYYALLDALNRTSESGIVDIADGRLRLARPWIEPATTEQRARRVELESAVAAAADAPAREAARAALERFMREEWPRVMTMSDDAPRQTRVLSRGDYLSPLERVAFAAPAFLPPLATDAPRNRLGLARWLFDRRNPLAARVAANRAWQHFLGDGLVRTPEDFGVQGDRPVQQRLLDTLAVELRDSGWSMKSLHRLIVTSRVYRQTSDVGAELVARDPDNRLLARAPRLRLPSMILRDSALAASGLLDTRVGGAPVYPYQPERVWEPLAITKERDFTYPASAGADLYRRSIYTFWRRTIAPANMFDASPRQSCRVRVPVTNSPLNALTMLNDATWVEAARVLAERVMHEAASPEDRLAIAFTRVVGRAPDAREAAILLGMLARQRERFRADGPGAMRFLAVGAAGRDGSLDPVEQAALASACLAILNLDEALTRG